MRLLSLGAWSDEPKDGSTVECVLLDWFAPHLHEDVDTLIETRGHCHLKEPGGSTPWVATPDTHAHWPMEREYRASERHDSIAQLRRGYTLPCCSRSTVMRRAHFAWLQVPHEKMPADNSKKSASLWPWMAQRIIACDTSAGLSGTRTAFQKFASS